MLPDDPGAPHPHYHGVRFYEDDAALCRIVADFIGDGLAANQPAVVIATPPHVEVICAELKALSFDSMRLQDTHQLIVLDAEQTLATFMSDDGRPDRRAFRRQVGGVLTRAAAGRTKPIIRAYGEMVDWLWRSGKEEAAIQLEVLWNELAQTHAFSLLCGYSLGNFYKHGAYETICAEHTHVVSELGQPTRIGVA